MNALEMQYAFENRAGQLYNFSPGKLESDQIQDYLNLAQDLELKERYSQIYGSTLEKFEFTEKIRREIGNIIDSYIASSFDESSSSLHKNGVFVTLPSNYLYGIEERCIVLNSDGSTGIAKVKPMTHDEYLDDIKNPFLWPTEDLIWRMDFGFTGPTGAKKHELISSEEDTIQQYTVRYLRRPQKVVLHPTNYQDCELDESTHESIVNRAVQMIASEK
jgi:hypothetical protein